MPKVSNAMMELTREKKSVGAKGHVSIVASSRNKERIFVEDCWPVK